MRPATRAPLAALLTFCLCALVACGGDDPDDTPTRTIDTTTAEEALLTITDVGAAYSESPEPEETGATGATGGTDCLSRATEEFESAKAATEVQTGFNKLAGAFTLAATSEAREPKPNEALQVSVISKFSSFADADRAETTLDELRGALQDCRSATYEQGTGSVSFDISVDDDEADDALDQQVNVTLDGEITSATATAPFTILLHYFRVDNHYGAVNVSVIGPSAQGADAELPEKMVAARERNTETEVQRLLDIGVDKFLGVAGG